MAETLFSGVRFVLIGFDSVSQAQYRSEMVNAGGVDVGRYDPTCTHVIVHARVYDDPVCVAARQDGITLVTDLWVEASLDLGTLVDAKRALYQPVKDLKGIPGADSLCLCLTGYQKPQRDDIMKMVDLMGAQFSKPLIAAKVTHLVCYKFEGEKYELAKRTKMKLINHQWLEDCLKCWDILPVDSYNKSGWELELMEAQASDSETDTDMDISVLHKLPNGFTSGSPSSRKPLRELHNRDQDASRADVPLCNGDESAKNLAHNISEQQNKANEASMIIKSVENNKIRTYLESGSKSSTTAGLDQVEKPEARELAPYSFNFHANEDADARVKGVSGISDAVNISEKSADADKELSKLSPNESVDRVSGNSGAELPSFSRKISDERMAGNDERNDKESSKYSSCGLEEKNDGGSMIKTTNIGAVNEVLTPFGKIGDSKCGSSINIKFNKRRSCFEGSDGSNELLNISRKSMKAMPEVSLGIPEKSFPRISGINSAEVTVKAPMLGIPVDENFKSAKVQSVYASSEVQEELLQKSTLTDERKVHNFATSSSSLKAVERTGGEAPIRITRSFDTEIDPMLIDVPQVSHEQKSGSDIDKTSPAIDQTLGKSKVKSATLKKPLKRGRTVLLAKSANTNNEIEENFSKGMSADLHLEEHAEEKSLIYNESAGAFKTQSNAISDVENLPSGEGEASSQFLNQEGIDKVLPSGAVRKKCFAKKSSNTRSKLIRSAFSKVEVSTSVTEEARKGLKESGVGNIVPAEKAEKPALTKVRKPTKNASAFREADKENKPNESGNINLNIDQERLQKSDLSSSKQPLSAKSKRPKLSKPEPSCFILSGHRLQRKEFQQIVRRLRGKVCRDTHHWSYEATHLIVPDPVRRTEKFFAAAAAGRWILKSDYLAACSQAGAFVQEDSYEWFKKGLNEDGAINLEAPRKWRLLRERTGHGALHGMRIIVYGDCIAPPLDTLKRAVKAGDGVILATSPPYTRFLKSGADYAIVSAGISRSDYWIQEFLKHEIPCVVTDYLVEYVCKSGYPLDKYALYGTHSWAQRSMQQLVSRSEEVIETSATPDKDDDANDGIATDDVACLVCGSRDREEVMLICGDVTGAVGCGAGSHIDCCNPPFNAVPEEDWFCPGCFIGSSSCGSKSSKSSKISAKARRSKSSSKL